MFAGVLSLNGRAPAELAGPADLLGALLPAHPPDSSGTWSEGPFLLSQAMLRTDRSAAAWWSNQRLPHRCPASGRVTALWGRLDNAEELARDLSRPAPRSDEELLLTSFERWGVSCAERLIGDFAAAIYDPDERRLWLVRDRIGVKPLYYRLDAQAMWFATSAAVLARLRAPGEGADRAWIARQLADVLHDERATGWSDVIKLAPGHWLSVDLAGCRTERYHTWKDDPPWTMQRDPARVEAYRSLLEEAVRCRMRETDLIGSESSGGLDSSTVTAYLARFLGDPRERLFAFGIVTQEQEPERIAETSRLAGIAHTYLLTARAQDNAESVARGLATVGYPEQLGSAFIPFYEECQRRGIRTLFSGFGGDETVTNSGTLLARELLDHHAYRALWRNLRGRPLWRALRVARALAIGPDWGAGHPGLQAAMAARWPHQLVRSEIVQELGLAEGYFEQAAFDAPYRRINEFVLQNRMRSLAPRLETCTLLAASYGIEYRWPLLDARLIQQFLSTPSIEKATRHYGRYLHRRAVDGLVSSKVNWNPTKDMGASIPAPGAGSFGTGVTAAELLREARRQRAHLHPILREIIDVPRLERQIDGVASGRLRSEPGFEFQFRRNVGRLQWLNHWLSGGPLPR